MVVVVFLVVVACLMEVDLLVFLLAFLLTFLLAFLLAFLLVFLLVAFHVALAEKKMVVVCHLWLLLVSLALLVVVCHFSEVV